MTVPDVLSAGDDPIGGAEAEDQLDRAKYAAVVVRTLDRIRLQQRSCVLGLVAPWGAGKTSILNLVRHQLVEQGKKAGWLIGEFNPWLFPDMESLQLAFFQELRAALPKDRRWRDRRGRVSDLGMAVAPIGKVTGLFGVDASGAIEKWAKLIGGDQSPTATMKRAEAALAAAGSQPILMIIDDLDRLTPDEFCSSSSWCG